MRAFHLSLVASVAFVLVGCTSTDTPPGSTTATSAQSGVDQLVPYSPSPTPFTERTSGFVPDTLTAASTDGGKLYLTPVTTAMTTEFVKGARSLSVFLTLENPGDAAWSGTIGADAEITDLNGASFPSVPPTRGDLHPDPERYGGSNRDLDKPVTITPGGSMKGVLVFHPTGGNRPITLRISVDDGTTWVEWATNLGVF
jgi:hypothetical protein